MKIKLCFLLSVLLFLTSVCLSKSVFAHPGNTDSSGCHTCHTNCLDWGLSYGEYHCHTPKTPTYVPPPSCPLNSYYNSLSETCECYSGYIVQGSSCVSQNQYCWDLLGYSSRYDSLSGNCECSYGYVIDSSGKCSSGNSVCWNKYGYNSTYNSLDKTCECSYGYVFNQAGTECISEDEACQDQFGSGSKATISGDKCECKYGYKWEGNKCVFDVSDNNDNSDTDYIFVVPATPTITPKPTVKPTPIPSPTSAPTSTPSPEVESAATEAPTSPTGQPAQEPTSTPKPLTAGETTIALGVLAAMIGLPVWVIVKIIKRFRKPKEQI